MYELEVNAVTSKKDNFKGVATITFDEAIKVVGLKILEKQDHSGLYVAMPSYQSNELDEFSKPIYKAVCEPRNKEFAAELKENITKLYEKSVETGEKVSMRIEDEKRELKSVVTPYNKPDSKMVGVGTIYIGKDFKINNVVVTQGKNIEYVNMPRYKSGELDEKDKPVYRDYAYPINADARKQLIDQVKQAYEQSLVETRKPQSR